MHYPGTRMILFATAPRPPYPRGMGFWFNLAQFGLIGMQVLR